MASTVGDALRSRIPLNSRGRAALATLAAALLALGMPAPGSAQPEPAPAPEAVRPPDPGPGPDAVLPPLVVEAPPPLSSSSQIIIPGKDFELRPQGRPGDILRLIPGFVIGQHHGGGKAEQYFLRGFDGDHGTDIGFFFDGLPVNLRSHAHGQGYTDLHFIIPETILRVDVFKGPYYPEYGDFGTAGSINFVTLDTVDENLVQAGGGSFGTQRYLTLLSPTRGAFKTLFAAEIYYSDGPDVRPQNYRRFNLFAKATASLAEDMTLRFTATYLRSDWFASGQIPERAVREKIIGRFGSIDDSEGGNTQRLNLNGTFVWKPSENQLVLAQAYASYYTLDLFSNFTFFLRDPENGDGIEQVDKRWYGGLDTRYERQDALFGVKVTSTAGLQYRVDGPSVILANEADRHRLSFVESVNIIEQSFSPYVKFDFSPSQAPWLRFVTGARGDIFTFDVRDTSDGAGTPINGKAVRAIPSVKANLVLGPWFQTEFFANFGTGFHSNDARAVILEPSLDALARAEGYEFGIRTRPLPRLQLALTYWALNLSSELAFVGDEGTTEALGPSRRFGGEFSTQVELLDWLTFNGNFTITRANFDNGDTVPLSPRTTAYADLTARLPWGLSTSLAMNYVGPRFLTEDRSVSGDGYTLLNFVARYRYKYLEAFLNLNNLLNQKYEEVQFFYTSRLRGERAEGVADIHFTPGAPFSVFGGLAVRF